MRTILIVLLSVILMLVVWMTAWRLGDATPPPESLVAARAACQQQAGLFPMPPKAVMETGGTGLRLLAPYYTCMYGKGYTNVPPLD